jgi:hypothetical protein
VLGLPDGGTVTVDGTIVVERLGLTGTVSMTDLGLPRYWEALDTLG